MVDLDRCEDLVKGETVVESRANTEEPSFDCIGQDIQHVSYPNRWRKETLPMKKTPLYLANLIPENSMHPKQQRSIKYSPPYTRFGLPLVLAGTKSVLNHYPKELRTSSALSRGKNNRMIGLLERRRASAL